MPSSRAHKMAKGQYSTGGAVGRALRTMRRHYADGGDVVKDRAMFLPLGTYGDGTTRAAWPGLLYEPAAAWKRMMDSGYRPGNAENTRTMAKDSFAVAGAVPLAGLAAGAVRPGVSLGSGGGRIKGYRGTGHPAKEMAGSPPPSEQFWMTGDRSPLSQRVADTYAEPFLYPDDAPAVMAVEARFKNPRVIDAKGAEWDKVPSPYHDNAPQPSNAIAQAAKEAGHDGVVIENVWDALNYSHAGSPSKSVAALRPGTVFDDYGNQLFSNTTKASAPGLGALEANRVRGYDIAPLDRSSYISTKDYRNRLTSNYFDGDVRKASSREVPVSTELPEVGAWRIDDFKGNYGHDIEHLIRAKLNELEAPELRDGRLDPMKRGDDERYADWLRRGLRPPPVEVLQTEDGAFRIMDGHRRYLAAKRAGMDDVEAWVSYAAPTQKYDANGRPIMTSLTYELARALQNAGVQQ